MIVYKILFRIIVYCYMKGIYFSRKLEKAYKRDINFRWLLQWQKETSHNTLQYSETKIIKICRRLIFIICN